MRFEGKDRVDAAMRTRVGCNIFQEMDSRFVSGGFPASLLDDGHRGVVTVRQVDG